MTTETKIETLCEIAREIGRSPRWLFDRLQTDRTLQRVVRKVLGRWTADREELRQWVNKQ